MLLSNQVRFSDPAYFNDPWQSVRRTTRLDGIKRGLDDVESGRVTKVATLRSAPARADHLPEEDSDQGRGPRRDDGGACLVKKEIGVL